MLGSEVHTFLPEVFPLGTQEVKFFSSAPKKCSDYYPFGLTMPGRSSNSANPNDKYKFTGHERDDEAGLNVVHMGARGYDPVIGRMMQVDKMSELYPNVSTYTYALNNPINAIDPDGNIVIFVSGFVPSQWAYQNNNQYIGGNHIRRNPGYRPYPPSRNLSRGGPTYLGETFSYWGGVDDLYSMAFNDNNMAYINASADDQSQASDRYEEGVAAGERFIAALESGNESLADGETIKIVGHSQGGAFAAGMAAAIANSKYAGLLETVHYLSPHQPGDFKHPSGVSGEQFSTQSDKISSKRNFLFGDSNLTRIDGIGVYNYHLRPSYEGGFGGHSANTYLGYLVGYFRGLGIPVTVVE